MPNEIYRQFMRAASLHSYGTAITTTNDGSLSYAELQNLVDNLSLRLKLLKIQRQERIAVLLSPGVDWIVLMLAIWGLDTIYVPLNRRDLSYAHSCISSLSIKWVVCDESLQKNFEHLEIHHLSFNLIALKVSERHRVENNPYSLAYTIHTSGTTREGKGGRQVHVPELSFLENVNALKSRLGVNRPRRFISLAEPTFDVSLIEVFTALFTGSALVIPPESMTRQPLKLFDYIKTASVDMMMLTPSLFLSLQEVNIKEILIGRTPVTDVVLGGECFPGNILLDSSRKIQLWNIYGTTECSVWATIYKIESDYSASQVPIGTPLGSTLVEIRDKKEDGTGELWIGGPSRVCHLDDEIESPEMRATGDIVKQDQDGCIYYVGRKGLDQIKRNGQRVHLSSIHKAIGTLPCVSACSIVYKSEDLFAFVVAKKPQDPDFLNMVLDALKSQLPSYSIPELVLVNEIPTTIHGKADKERLIADHRASRAVDQASLPVTDIENVIRRHIGSSESLDMDKLFLTQGGTSLLAVRVIDDFKIVFPQMDTDCESKLLESLLHHPLAETARLLSGLKSNKKRKVDADQVTSNGKGGLSITGDLIWKVDLGKCIDASPIIHKGTAYIGSHSGRFVAVDTSSGSVIWSCVLPGRIEGTAVISRDGRFAVVGCYDGKLYYIDLRLGTISATFQTGGEIKCRPAIDSTTGAIWVGSYDHFLYGVSIAEDGVTISLVSDKIDLRAPLFSSPLIDSVRRRMFACSTAGVIHHMDLSDNNPCIICSKTMPKPIFSSPCLEPKSGDIIVGCTDGKIYRLTGSLATVWAFDTNGPVFSSPVLWKEKFVVCGSHSKSLVGLDLTSGNLNFKEEMGAPIFASPAPLHDSLSWVSINGVLVIRTPSGPDKSIQLPGEVFSSPLLAGNQVLVGCRNDKFYAISI